MSSTCELEHRSGHALKPYSAYKDSGVEWLGKVPAHWEVRRLGTIAEMRVSNVDKHSRNGERPVRLCNYMDVYKADRIRTEVALMAATATVEEIERFRLRPGDVLITKDSEAWDDIGVPALVEGAADNTVCGYHLALLRPFSGTVTGGFLFRAVQSAGVAYQFHVRANGVTRYGLTHNAIKSAFAPLPTVPEQTAIAHFLDHTDQRIQRYLRVKEKLIGASGRADQSTSLIGEYRTRLIADVVTGKLDVREAAAGSPEVPRVLSTALDKAEDGAANQEEVTEMTDWDTCPAVERTPGKVSGAWVFTGTRIPLSALYENLAGGATVEEFVEWFPGVDEKQVRAVLEHEAQALRTALAR